LHQTAILNTMLRWIAILLIAALPLRGALAAAQICPWMAAGMVTVMVAVTPAAISTDSTIPSHQLAGATEEAAMQDMRDMPGGCAGMSHADGSCTLQAACAATPLPVKTMPLALPQQTPVHMAWRAVDVRSVFMQVPQRVPITVS
jgi:hypothetical protein